MTTCPCGSRHIEQKDLGLCAVCNRARRKAETASPPKPRKSLRPVSVKMAGRIEAKRASVEIVKAVSNERCAACGSSEWLTPSHFLSTKQFPQHEANPINQEILCIDCHNRFEHNKPLAAQMHSTWPQYIAVVKFLEPAYYALLNLKNPTLYP